MSLLGVDVGTTACKVVAFRRDGVPLAAASREYPLLTPAPGRFELDSDEVWQGVAACIRSVNERVTDDPVEALAISSQGEAVTPLDRAGRALALSPVTADGRAAAELAALEAAIGRRRLAYLTGQPPAPIYTIAKLMWWRVHDPDLVAQTWKFLCYGDLIAFRLGAEPAIDHSMAARTMAFDIHRRDWSDDILAVAGIAREQLPAPVSSGTPIGAVAPAVARELGFVGAPVIVAGGHDQPCGAFGAGVERARDAMLAIGTTACLAPVFPTPRDDLLERGYPCYPHVVPGAFITLAGNFTGASLLRWFRDRFGAEERRIAAETGRDVFDLLVAQASAEPSSLLLLPHFAGAGAPHDDPQAKGALVGLSFATTRGDIVRALLEGVMFEMALNRERLAEAGVPIDAIVAIGGGARSDRWLQITADILGTPVRRAPDTDAACWGAAALAARGASRGDADPARGRGEERESFVPQPDNAEYYRARMGVYRALYDALRSISHAL